jgi:hypothetical protein
VHSEKDIVDRVKGITRYGYVLKNSGEFILIESIAMACELLFWHPAAYSGGHFCGLHDCAADAAMAKSNANAAVLFSLVSTFSYILM